MIKAPKESGCSLLRADNHIICVGEKIVWNRPGRAGRDNHSKCVGKGNTIIRGAGKYHVQKKI